MPARRHVVAIVTVGFIAAGCGSAETATGVERSEDNAVAIEVLNGESVEEPTPIATTTTAEAGSGESAATEPDPAEGESAPAEATPLRYSVVAEAVAPSVTARTAPDAAAPVVADLNNPTATGSPLVFRVVPGGTSSSDWVEVQLPVQPNGTTGWVPREQVTLSDNPYRVEISRADYALRVFHLNELWVETPIAVGNGETPTPVGEFYLLELLQPSDPGGPYGPYAFGLSGFSEVLTSFGTADEAIIGLHGTNDPASLGTDVSHGCIRLANEVIEQFAAVLPLGTPVSIT